MNSLDRTDDDRLLELARIFAVGFLRLRPSLTTSGNQRHDEEKLSESGQNCLEVSDETVLSVHTGKRFPRLSERSEHVD